LSALLFEIITFTEMKCETMEGV